MSDLTRPIIGIENRTAQEVFDIMCDRFRAAERALAERAGGVKVLSYGMKLIAEAITQHFGERDEYCEDDTTIQDAWDAFDALTTEPAAPLASHPRETNPVASHETANVEDKQAAPEGRQEAVAFRVHDFHIARQPAKAKGIGPEPTEYLYPADRKQHAKDVARMMGGVCTPLYTRPSGQAVTEEWREIKQHVQPRIADGYTAVAISKPGYWFVKGPGPDALKAAMEAGRHE